MKVLVVDDDVQIRRVARINLEARGYTVIEVGNGSDAIDSIASDGPDVVVLDLGLPRTTGLEVIRAVRPASTVPIIVLSGRSQSADKVEALDAGANDYVTKPFSVDELLARIRALTRTVALAEHEVVVVGPSRVDLTRRDVTRSDADGSERTVRLTPTEWGVLTVLVRNPDRLVSKRELLAAVWGPAYTSEEGYLRLYLAQLRRKLEADPRRPRHLVTEPGLGYRFTP